MADSDSHANWQQITKLALSIAAVVGIVIIPRLPNSVVRPNVNPPVENRFVSAQSVDARLWQDPFEAVDMERARPRAAGQGTEAAALEARRTSAESMQQQVRARAADTLAPPLVLLAFVPGGPYPENVESRRRVRYATLSGLRAAGLIPVDAEHIGYFETRHPAREAGLPPLVVYEWLQVTTSRKSKRLDNVLLLWLDERIFGNKTVPKTAALLGEIGVCDASGRSIPTRLVMLGPAESSSVRRLVEDADRVNSTDVNCLLSTLVLSTATVPDSFIIPGWGLDGPVKGSVRERMGAATLEGWLAGAGLFFARILPTDDELVHELNEELTARAVSLRAPETRVAVLSEWDTLYGRRGVEILSDFICRERRGSNISRNSSLPSDNSWCGGRVQLFEYPRGLDGVIPGRDAKKGAERGDKATGSGAFQWNSDPGERAEGASQVDYVRRLAAELDRLVSSSGDSRAPWRNDHSLVIGVLGSDLYDKLLILQALRPQHPHATFFTFDLDARMLHSDEFEWARNLLVISPLGLRLRPKLQGSIPPFRDSYQTASFLSARIAVDYARHGADIDPAGPIIRTDWKPRVFEIGRGKEFDLSVEGEKGECRSALTCGDVTPEPPALAFDASRLDWWWVAAIGLAAIIALTYSCVVRDAFRRSLSGWWGRLTWAVSLACVGAIWLFLAGGGAASLQEVRPEPFSWGGGVSMWPSEILLVMTFLLALVFALIAARTVNRAANAMASQYDLAPGATPAPGLSMALGSAGGGRATTNGHHAPPAPGAAHSPGAGRWRQIYDAVTLQGFDRFASSEPADSVQLWAEYRRQSQGWRRNLRVVLSMVLVSGVVICLMLYFGLPHSPARGRAMRIADGLLLFALCTPVVLWLQMYVVDVVRLCDTVTRALAAECPTVWPPKARERFWSPPCATIPANGPSAAGARAIAGIPATAAPNGDALLDARGLSGEGLLEAGAPVGTVVAEGAPAPRAAPAGGPDDDTSYWLDIRFTSDWTARVSWLAYLPLIAICLMMFARSRFFDDWDTSPGLSVGFGLSIAYMIGCVGLLMHRATALRGGAVRQLRARLRRLTGSGASAELDRVKLMIQDVERADEGAFAPLTRQPIFGALALAFGTTGITAVIQYVMGIR
jgi:hypothetical protein